MADQDNQEDQEDHGTADVIVVGGGSTGTNAAWYARDNGLSVTLVESALVGGECSYWACIPSKALLGPPEAVAAARRLPGAAAAVTGEVDVAAVFDRRDTWTNGWDDAGQVDWMTSIGATLVRGVGRLAGNRTVEVALDDGGARTLRARTAVVVATGSRAQLPPIEGLADTPVWGSHEATSAKVVPDHLVVLGAGAVGCEMAQAYRRLGARVTLIQRSDRLLSSSEPLVGELLQQAFEDEGIEVLTGASAERVSRQADDGPVTVLTSDGREVTGDELLVALGRTPNSDDIGLQTVGIEPGGSIDVDDQLRVVGVDDGWLYAAGDVTGRALLTHQGKYQARLVGDIVAGRERSALADHRAVPQVVFTDPPVAQVGTTEREARDAGLDVRTAEADPTGVAGGSLHGHDRGGAKLVIDDTRNVLVGATFVGPAAGEVVHAATVAIVGEVAIDRLWHAVPAFPTVSEVWLRLLEADRGL